MQIIVCVQAQELAYEICGIKFIFPLDVVCWSFETICARLSRLIWSVFTSGLRLLMAFCQLPCLFWKDYVYQQSLLGWRWGWRLVMYQNKLSENTFFIRTCLYRIVSLPPSTVRNVREYLLG